jgi:hypothetical protein
MIFSIQSRQAGSLRHDFRFLLPRPTDAATGNRSTCGCGRWPRLYRMSYGIGITPSEIVATPLRVISFGEYQKHFRYRSGPILGNSLKFSAVADIIRLIVFDIGHHFTQLPCFATLIKGADPESAFAKTPHKANTGFRRSASRYASYSILQTRFSTNFCKASA